jgi:acyl carrier protein
MREDIREIVADILEIDPDDIGPTSHFWTELGADSLQGIEILSALERRFAITIEQSSLPRMEDVESTYLVVVEAMATTSADAARAAEASAGRR